jgi:hypothetical protein
MVDAIKPCTTSNSQETEYVGYMDSIDAYGSNSFPTAIPAGVPVNGEPAIYEAPNTLPTGIVTDDNYIDNTPSHPTPYYPTPSYPTPYYPNMTDDIYPQITQPVKSTITSVVESSTTTSVDPPTTVPTPSGFNSAACISAETNWMGLVLGGMMFIAGGYLAM